MFLPRQGKRRPTSRKLKTRPIPRNIINRATQTRRQRKIFLLRRPPHTPHITHQKQQCQSNNTRQINRARHQASRTSHKALHSSLHRQQRRHLLHHKQQPPRLPQQLLQVRIINTQGNTQQQDQQHLRLRRLQQERSTLCIRRQPRLLPRNSTHPIPRRRRQQLQHSLRLKPLPSSLRIKVLVGATYKTTPTIPRTWGPTA